MGGACITYGREETCIQGFGGGKLREDHLVNRRRWEDNIKMDLQEVECEGLDRCDSG